MAEGHLNHVQKRGNLPEIGSRKENLDFVEGENLEEMKDEDDVLKITTSVSLLWSITQRQALYP